ncbi:MAG TPA: LacI family DNA-binding transcriptional regulator [Streptosporangiaceae bacterium]|jgi:LacI family transcriptional regulator|nr:LacI family DNA-binding transcriptional regulator [Streptosporangiaceae bacterium]
MADLPATLRDVAAAARVHPATASRALNPDTRMLVSDETARRVADAAAALGYRPNPVARSLRTRRSNTIGVLIPDLNNPLFPPMVRGLEDRLTAAGYVALLGNTDGDTGKEQVIFEQMRARHVDGFVLATAHAHDPVLAEAAEAGLAVVLMNRTDPEHDFSSVSVDNEQGMQMSVAHLVALGHTRIAHIAGPPQVSTGEGRRRGYNEGLKRANLDPDEDLVVAATGFTVEEGVRCCRELLARRELGGARFSAIAVANDMLAVGCFTALDEAGLDCPGDLSLVGFNDMPFVDRLRPPLTTIRFPHYQLGTEAAELLLGRVDHADAAVQVRYLDPELVVRGSTAAPDGR